MLDRSLFKQFELNIDIKLENKKTLQKNDETKFILRNKNQLIN